MLIAFLVDTGARNSEGCTLLKQDIKERVILLRGKGNKERQVPINPLLRKYMIRYERIRDFYFKDRILKNYNYFLSNTGLQLTPETIERVVGIAGKIAEVRKEIRCSQVCIQLGIDVEEVSVIYIHWLKKVCK